MKHTDTYKKYKELEALDRKELIEAVKAHGGRYTFYDCESEDADEKWHDKGADEMPIIMCSRHSDDENIDHYITHVEVSEEGYLSIYGFPKEYGSPSDERLLDWFEFGHIGYITDYIPETNDVKDVTIPEETPDELPVLFLTKDHIESVGYDPNISDEDFRCLASSIGKHLDHDDFMLSLKYACEHIGLEPLNSDDDE